MTQQTTADRIAALINEGVDCSCDGGWTDESLVGALKVAQIIATEIDALTAQRDEAQRIIGIYNTSRDEVIAQLCEMNDALRAERDEAMAKAKQLTGELAEALKARQYSDHLLRSANAELQNCESALRLALAGTYQNYFAIPARIDDVRAALATAERERDEAHNETQKLRWLLQKAQAEVERLRPAAEAWEAYEDYQSTTSQSNMIRTITEKWPSMADVAQKARVFMAAAARARAAKEGRG